MATAPDAIHQRDALTHAEQPHVGPALLGALHVELGAERRLLVQEKQRSAALVQLGDLRFRASHGTAGNPPNFDAQ